jgi:hypothetical protein
MNISGPRIHKPNSLPPWRRALVFALPATVLVLSLFFYWFATADRYFVFLYYHDMGPVVPDTSPFSTVTASRYWMAGLVAAGAILVLYAAANWLLGRLAGDYRAPVWWQVWGLCAIPLLNGIPLITMTANQHTLPLRNALQATFATLMGLILALLPGRLAAERPVDLLWMAADGWGVMLILTTIAGLQNLLRWLARGGLVWVHRSIVVLVIALGWLLLVTALQFWRHKPVTSAATMFLAGLGVAYVLMPLVHNLYVLAFDGYYYITNSNNFFADTALYQLAAWLVAGATSIGFTGLRSSLAQRAEPLGKERLHA